MDLHSVNYLHTGANKQWCAALRSAEAAVHSCPSAAPSCGGPTARAACIAMVGALALPLPCPCLTLPSPHLPCRYVVPPAHRARFEQLMRSLLPDLFRACPEFMRHKVSAHVRRVAVGLCPCIHCGAVRPH